MVQYVGNTSYTDNALILQRISNRTNLNNDEPVRRNGYKDTFGEDCDDLAEDTTSHNPTHTSSQVPESQPDPPSITVDPVLPHQQSSENQQSGIAQSIPDDEPPLTQPSKRSRSNKANRQPVSHSQPSTVSHSKKRQRRRETYTTRASPAAVAPQHPPVTADSETDDDRAVNFSFTQSSEGTRIRSKQFTVTSGSSDEHE